MNVASISEAEVTPGGNGASHRLNHDDRPPLAGIWRDICGFIGVLRLRDLVGSLGFRGKTARSERVRRAKIVPLQALKSGENSLLEHG